MTPENNFKRTRLREYGEKYRQKNRDKINARMKEYRRRPEVKEKQKAWRQKNREKFREYYRLWYKKNGRRRAANYAEAILEWKQNNPEKMVIRARFTEAVRLGKIKRPESCSKCGKERRVQSHHYDYEDYRHFIWVCASCHKLIHLGEKH